MTKMEQQPPEQPVESEAEKAVRIKQLRKEIKAGTYRVPALELADRMLERLDWQ
jgi:anti-sigma28 factor (negative regulator of flagellin synthesis)